MHLEYQITSQNDVERQGGNQETFLTVSTTAALDRQQLLILNNREVCWHPWLNTSEGKGLREVLREKTAKAGQSQAAELSLEMTVLFNRGTDSRGDPNRHILRVMTKITEFIVP